MRPALPRLLIAAASLLAATVATACPVCIGSVARSPAQDLVQVPRAVLALPEGQQYRVVATLKGDAPPALLDEVLVRDAADTGKPLLLVRDEAWPMWVSLGAMEPRHAPTLRELATARPPPTDAPAWQRRVDVALPHLRSREPLLAEIAYLEGASAPYAVLRAARPQLDAKAVRGWLADPQFAARQPLYILLLGIAGGPSDAAAIEAQLDTARQAHDATNLAARLTAELELRGPARVTWLEDRYLRDGTRTAAEVVAALLALSVHGNAPGDAIPRPRVIEAYRVFMRSHPDMAGLVAADLAAWQYWDAAPEYLALLESGPRQQYASLVAIRAYLQQRPAAGTR